ncbi:MAG TPA: LysM domain-containing protein, partial [Verrucomicrobiae bacterium]|nr:LysM domain-containing protein [Verrucomicrobiae bacterium]
YQQYLKFDPQAPNADVVNQRIIACKQQLVADVMAMPSAPAALKQIEQLTEANQKLQADLAYYSNQWFIAKMAPALQKNNFTPERNAGSDSASATQNFSPKPVSNARPHTHTVAAGETLAGIARKYDLRLNALLEANPALNPKKLRIGQSVNLPSP